MDPILVAIIIFVVIFGCLFLCYMGFKQISQENKVKNRVEEIEKDADGNFTFASSYQPETETRKNELSDSFQNRILVPLALSLSDFVQKLIPTNGKSFIRLKLVHAGYPKPQHFKTFMGVQLMVLVLPIAFALLLTVTGRMPPMVANSSLLTGLIAIPAAAGMGILFPMMWLVDNAAKRQKSIQKALPDFLDLLVISVEAGMGMDVAIQKISKLEGLGDSPEFRNELFKYTGDINLGKSRRQALLDFAERIGLEDLNSVVSALVQAFEMGTGVAQTLRVQSDTLRSKRLYRAEANAAKVATKMVLPTYLFFFPAIFIVMLGPMIMDAIGKISGMMAK
jgi:tight adherence protein C